MLELTNVCYKYTNEQYAVNDVSLTIQAGEFVAIAGRNGSGKTTLTKLMMSLIKPTAGSITFQGQNTARLSPADMARHIGYVFQNPDRQIFRDTVGLEVAYGPEQLGFSPEKIRDNVEKALLTVGLAGMSSAYPRALTKGQKQKVAIASALAMEPAVLILDEPTSGQDAQSSQNLMELLSSLNREGCSIILVTHNMEIMARHAKRAVIMDHGVKAYDGTVAELFGQDRGIEGLGLREPAAAKISRYLAGHGVSITADPQELARDIYRLAGGEANA